MTPATHAQNVYATSAAPIRTDRAAEYDVFARVTRRLQIAAGRGTSGFPELVAALHDNHTLWITLAADVAEPENLLPAPLRARIFYLAEFTALHSRKILAGKADAAILIDINKSVMRGLHHRGTE